jgi:hypothetical protein
VPENPVRNATLPAKKTALPCIFRQISFYYLDSFNCLKVWLSRLLLNVSVASVIEMRAVI